MERQGQGTKLRIHRMLQTLQFLEAWISGTTAAKVAARHAADGQGARLTDAFALRLATRFRRFNVRLQPQQQGQGKLTNS